MSSKKRLESLLFDVPEFLIDVGGIGVKPVVEEYFGRINYELNQPSSY